MKKLSQFCKNHKSRIIFVLMLCVGFFLRLYPLITQNYLQDEMATVAFAKANYPLLNHFIYPLDDRPWLYYLFVKLLYTIYPNPIFLRMMSMIIGLLSVYVLYRLTEKIHKHFALLTAFTLFFSLSRIDYSWQIRDPSLLLLATSFLLLFGFSLLQEVEKQGGWKQRTSTFLSIPIVIGCLTNYVFIVFSTAYILFLCVSIFLLTKKLRFVWTFLLQITIRLFPLICILLWYLFGQSDVTDIVTSNLWIPKATFFTFLSINSTMLGLTTYFNEFYQPTAETFKEVLAINIGLVIFFALTGVLLITRKLKFASKLLPLYFFGGLFVHLFCYLLVLALSNVLGINLILHRTFIRSGTMFLLSFNIALYIWFINIIQPKFRRVVGCFVVATYLLLFFANFTIYYQISDIAKLPITTQNNVITVIDRYYESGDQIVFFPIHYQCLYIPFYYKNKPKYAASSKLAYYEMEKFNMENPILRQKLSEFSGETSDRFQGKILFVEERTIFSNTPQGLPDETIVQNTFLHEKIKKYCLENPVQIDASANFIVHACRFKPSSGYQ